MHCQHTRRTITVILEVQKLGQESCACSTHVVTVLNYHCLNRSHMTLRVRSRVKVHRQHMRQADIQYPGGGSIVVGGDYRTVGSGTAMYSRYRTSRPWTAAVWRTASSGYPLPWISIVLGECNRTVVTGAAIYTINICCLAHRVRRISSIREEAVSWWVGTIEPLGILIQPQQHCTGWPRKQVVELVWPGSVLAGIFPYLA